MKLTKPQRAVLEKLAGGWVLHEVHHYRPMGVSRFLSRRDTPGNWIDVHPATMHVLAAKKLIRPTHRTPGGGGSWSATAAGLAAMQEKLDA